MKVIEAKQTGGPEVLNVVERDIPVAGVGQVVVKLEAIGVNFIDVYHRTGLYPLPLPFVPGMEGAGRVETVGPDVTELSPRDRVAYAMQIGAYAEYAVVPANRLVRVPEGVKLPVAAAAMLQGMSALSDHVSLFTRKRRLGHCSCGSGGCGPTPGSDGKADRRACHRDSVERSQGSACSRSGR